MDTSELFKSLRVEKTDKPSLDLEAYCPNCTWKGKPSDCESHEETESWEMPWIRYTVFFCPECNSDGVEVEPVDDEGEEE